MQPYILVLLLESVCCGVSVVVVFVVVVVVVVLLFFSGGGGGGGGGYMPVRTVIFFLSFSFFSSAELCFVCAGWCFLLLFMHFF